MTPTLTIKGRPQNISLEEARSWIAASLCVLSYHRLWPCTPHLTYKFRKKLDDKNNAGLARRSIGVAEICSTLCDQETFTTILHETIHLCVDFPKGSVEVCTSTLCSRFKGDVANLAHILLNGTYKRAAAIAHCKISYPPVNGKDYYNKQEDKPITWTGKKYRREK